MLLSPIILLSSVIAVGHPEVHSLTLEGQRFEVHLHEVALRSDSFQVLAPAANGRLAPIAAPASVPLRGEIHGSSDFIITGRRNADGSLRFLRFKERSGTRAWRMEGDDPKGRAHPVLDEPFEGACGTHLLPKFPSPPVEGGIAGGGCAVRCEIGFDLDWEFYSDMGLNETAAVEAVEDSLNEVDALYSTQLLCEFELTGMIVRTNQSTDPYYGIDGAGNLLDMLRNTWNPSGFPIPHDVGHLISGTYASDGILGLAWVTAVCQSYRYGMSRTTSPGVIAHEVGHNFSLGHCIDPSCTTMCGACMDFGPISALQARNYIASRWCVEQISGITAPVPPYLHDDHATTIDGEHLEINVLANDVDGNCNELTLVGVDSPTALGGLTLITGEQILYVPPSTLTGTDTFDYTVTDGTGLESTGTVTVDVYRSQAFVGLAACPESAVSSIAAAFAALHPEYGGTIHIGPGTWTANIDWTGTGPIELRSTHGPDATILDGVASSSLLAIDIGDAECTINGFTFAGGATPGSGGGASIVADTARIESCRFISCSAHETGGAIAFDGRVLLVTDCRFEDCSAIEGGAIHALATSSANATRCDFVANEAFERAGAVYAQAPILRFTNALVAMSVAPTAGAIFATEVARFTDSFVCGSGGNTVVAGSIDLSNSVIAGECSCEFLPWIAGIDCDENGIDDRCQVLSDPALDADQNGTLDSCAISIPGVPVQWTMACGGNDHFYEVRIESVNWQISRLLSQLRGGMLVSVSDADEQAFLFTLLERIDAAFEGQTGPWMGLYRQSNAWAWLDDTPLAYLHWASGQPQWDDGAATMGTDGWWAWLPLDQVAPAYIVEYPPRIVTATVRPIRGRSRWASKKTPTTTACPIRARRRATLRTSTATASLMVATWDSCLPTGANRARAILTATARPTAATSASCSQRGQSEASASRINFGRFVVIESIPRARKRRAIAGSSTVQT